MATDSIVQQLDASQRFLSALEAFVKAQILDTFLDQIPGVDVIAQSIETQLRQASSALSIAESAIKGQIEPLLAGAVPNFVNSLIGIAEAFQQDIANLIGNIATTEDVLATAITTIREHSPALAKWIAEHVTNEFGNVALGVLRAIELDNPESVNPVLDELLHTEGLPPWVHNIIVHARARNAPFFAFLLPAVLLASILPALGAIVEPNTVAVRQSSYRAFPTKEADAAAILKVFLGGGMSESEFYYRMGNNGYNDDVSKILLASQRELIDPETLTRAYVRGEVPKADWEKQIVARGLSTEAANLIWQASLPLLSEDALRQSWLRGIISTEEHDHQLARYGYTEDQASRLRQLYYYIPGPQDLIHMGIRNVFVPEIVERFQLDADKPAAFVKAAAQQGISADWAGKFWQAHWIMPGREAFFEMFQRTIDEPLDPHADTITLSDGTEVHNIIGRDTLNLALRDIDTPPFYRKLLTEIAYHPLTRIDIRRMAQIGQLTPAEVERAYLDLGYNLPNAKRLADFTSALAAKTRKDEASVLVDGLRRQILRLYTANKLSADAAKQSLADIGFSAEEIDVYLAESDVIQQSEFAAAMEAGIGKLYVAGQISADDATARLTQAGVPDAGQALLMSKWNLEIEYRGGTAHIHQHKELTKGEVLAAFVDGLIDQPTAEGMLEDLGYEQTGADAEIALAQYRAARAVKTSQIDAVKASYVNGTIEALDASNRLDALFVPADQRDAYLETWGLQRETRTERIPLATLRDMAKGGWITKDVLLSHLRRHRFTEDDAALLVNFWMAQNPPKGLIGVSGTGS